MSDKVSVTRKGKGPSGKPFEFSIGVQGMSVNGIELPSAIIQGTLDKITDDLVREIESGSREEPPA